LSGFIVQTPIQGWEIALKKIYFKNLQISKV